MESNKDETSSFERYLRLGIERYSGKSWTIGDYINNEADFYINVEMGFEQIEQALLKLWQDKTITSEANIFIEQADTILNMLLNGIEKNAINPHTQLHDKLPFIENTIENIKERLKLILLKNEVSEGKLPILAEDKKEDYFILLFSDQYQQIEQRLHNADYIDINRKWLKSANELVNFLMVLEDHKKFRREISAKQKKDFIEIRYQKNITQANKPSKRKIIESDKILFNNFIKNSD